MVEILNSAKSTAVPSSDPVNTSSPLTYKVFGWPAFRNRAWNPYNAMLYEELVRQGVDVREWSPKALFARGRCVWHLHWPESVLLLPSLNAATCRFALFFLLVLMARCRGVQIAWTIHNVAPHETRYPILQRALYRTLGRLISGCICLSNYALAEVQRTGLVQQNAITAVIPHGHYRSSYPDSPSGSDYRKRVGIDSCAIVIAFIGSIRPYKNVELLIEAFRTLRKDREDIWLILAGEPMSTELGDHVKNLCAGDDHIVAELRFASSAEIAEILSASDLITLPFSEITSSGSAVLALSFNRPVLVPAFEPLRELADSAGPGWVFFYQGAFKAACLNAALVELKRTPRTKICPLHKLNWDNIAAATKQFYEDLLNA